MVQGIIRIDPLCWIKSQEFVQKIKGILVLDIAMKPLFHFALLTFGKLNFGEEVKFVDTWPDFRGDGAAELADESKLWRTSDCYFKDAV